SEVQFIANYDPDCQLEKIISIWALSSNQYVDSDAIMDPEDGSVYVYGPAYEPLALNDGTVIGQGFSASYFYLIKYNRNLDRQWVYQFGFDMAQSGTSPYFDKVQVYPGINGEVLLTGTYGTESSPLINGRSLPTYMDGYGTFAVLLNAASQPQWVLDGSLNDFGYASRIFKAFPLPNGDFVLAGNTNTGYYSLGNAQFTFLDGQANNQFVFRIDPAGNPVWTRQFESQGPVQEGKKKSASSQALNSDVFYDAITWKNRLLYLAAPFMNPAFSVASDIMNLIHPSGFYVAALDLIDGTEVWGYALSSDDVSLHGFDVDRSGNVSLMGYNYATQNLDGLSTAAVVDGSFLFHLGLDYNGEPLWYTNASLATAPYYDLSGVDLEVLPNGEVFSSLRMNAANEIVLGESRVSDAATQSSWVVELASDVVLGGIVSDASDNPVYPGYVKAYKSAWWGMYPEVDTAFLQDDGSYLFDDLYPGNYTLLAVPDADLYPNAICTYMGDRTGWVETPFYNLVPKFNSTTMNIKLTEVDPLSSGDGSGEMSGEISLEGEMDDALKGTLARPAKKAAVVLLKKTKKSTLAGEVVAFTETDEFGMFSFTNVPDGDYLLHVEVPGLEMLEMHDVTIVGNQLVAGLNYTIGEDGVYIGWPTGISLLENETLSIYPNPGPGLILMDLPAEGDYEVKIYAIDGRMVLQEQFTSAGGARSINLSGASDGTYFIQVKGPTTDVTTKYIKK
ncbi:MAG: T9SS type A sorting domain-containing protein, partial [Bacteroidota bacterium]|nr:T9SS type A sorting domain-containing protein [Bacteroidota bacterium]